jgi:hypothetical protein
LVVAEVLVAHHLDHILFMVDLVVVCTAVSHHQSQGKDFLVDIAIVCLATQAVGVVAQVELVKFQLLLVAELLLHVLVVLD